MACDRIRLDLEPTLGAANYMCRSFWYMLFACSAIILPSLLIAETAADADSVVRSPADQYVWRHELYSENILLTREELLVLSAQHRSNLGGTSPFDASGVCGLGLHAGYDIASPAGLDTKYYNYSFAYAAPGLLCRGAFYALVLESRRKVYFEQDDEVIGNGKRPTWDHRGVVALYHDRETSLGAHWQLFNQAYFETVFTSGDRQNLIAAGHNRYRVGGA